MPKERFAAPSRSVFAWLMFLVATTSASADVVHLTDGREIEGKTRWLESGHLEITLASGAITVPADQVRRIEERETPAEILDRRQATLAADDLSGALELVRFAAAHEELHERARALAFGLLARSPAPPAADQSPASKEQRRLRGGVAEVLSGPLDYHLVDGVWQPPELYYPSQGFVLFRGRWVPAAEAREIRAARRKRLAESDERKAQRSERARARASDRVGERVDRAARELARAEARVIHYQEEAARHKGLAAEARQRLAEWDAEVRRLNERAYAAQLIYDRWCLSPCACLKADRLCDCGWVTRRNGYLTLWNADLHVYNQARRERDAARRALVSHEADVEESLRRLAASQKTRAEKATAMARAERDEAEAARELERASDDAQAAEDEADDARDELDDARDDD